MNGQIISAKITGPLQPMWLAGGTLGTGYPWVEMRYTSTTPGLLHVGSSGSRMKIVEAAWDEQWGGMIPEGQPVLVDGTIEVNGNPIVPTGLIVYMHKQDAMSDWRFCVFTVKGREIPPTAKLETWRDRSKLL
jgi:hypothetical protein